MKPKFVKVTYTAKVYPLPYPLGFPPIHNFRIVERSDGSIIIQERTERTWGILWWKETTQGWESCDRFGYTGSGRQIEIYPTLKAAQKAVERFEREQTKVLWP